jgi:hypothetical protein
MDQYSAAIAEFSRTAAIVNMRMGVMYKGDYDRLTKAVDEARVLTEKAHRELIREFGGLRLALFCALFADWLAFLPAQSVHGTVR